jgi:L,D-peptidoglycan transpeptidase YkuD (ErfK/YbiS/YcfS/YnhG family)
MDGLTAEIETYERAAPGRRWTHRSGPVAAVVGSAGVGWGYGFRHLASSGEPVKQEGDKRSPAGIFPLGVTFGFESAPNPGHLILSAGQHVCVDDAASPHYSRIVSRSEAGAGIHGEEMWTVPLYRRGIVIDYETSRAAKSGSCIFVHVWEKAGSGTAGCVAAPEATVAALQEIAAEGKTAIAIVPRPARDKLNGCLP